MRVLIAGAGIGGLTAALSLQRAGIDVLVHEVAAEILPEELQAVIDDFKEKTGFGIDALNSRCSYQIDARTSQ